VQQRQQDAARISTSNLETLLNQAGEVSIFRSRIEQELSNANLNLAELARTVNRVKEQLRKMEIETEATILYQHKDETQQSDFDPLEMDQYSNVQQLSRALAESVNDLQSLETLLENQFRETEALLLQQSRVMTDLQDNLMRVRMIPFARYAPRFARIVRQIANDTGKEVELNVIGADSEIDRQVIERMQAPLEHMIRNAVIHGIESPQDRSNSGKDPEGTIELRLSREGTQLILELEDDGTGLDLEKIKSKALDLGILTTELDASDADLAQLILNSGFSTATEVTQNAGRGVGMDVVASEIKQLGGTLQISTTAGKGTLFLMRLPYTRAINHALLVRAGEENYAIPIHKIDGVAKMSLTEVQRLLATQNPVYKYADQDYEIKTLSQVVGSSNTLLDPDEHELSVIMVTGGDHHAALVVSELFGSREVVIKPVGPQIASIRGISGATILGDGQIVIILDMDSILGVQLHEIEHAAPSEIQETNPLILVVDDSITVRRVTERLLERNSMDVLTARDGLDALTVLQDQVPDLILMDIEMPRMDGYELAEHVRKDERISHIPIIMITSRTGDKHRNRAIAIGVDDYLGKPYREDQLLEAIKPHLAPEQVN
jgi:chemosensory pili system protein ChpA (sensor histidine kinase/response regulator)